MPQETDRWLIDGNCDLCRRNPYCATRCTKNKERLRAAIRNLIMQQTCVDKVKQAMSEGELRWGSSI